MPQELSRGARRGGLGERAPDVESGVVVGSTDSDAAVRLDVEGGRRIELSWPRAVARLPGGKQLCEHAAVTGRERGGDVEERVGERTRDLVPMQVIGTGHDVALMCLQPLVVLGRNPPAQHVDGLGLLGEPGGQLLGYKDIRLVGDREDAGDRVVVGDRDEVHPPSFGQFVHLPGRGSAFRKRNGALDLESGKR